ncbi:hypothetical protein C2G38_2029484 [Gigaspora rosea]|uniref:Uncharacterized protein n=1 Tax=Gigaspora rosea TaxID=44941 RepID=A0A397VZE5_9GLOM|nr:hypothetical protein C2G38_2029484 [Gigaspora rosea]
MVEYNHTSPPIVSYYNIDGMCINLSEKDIVEYNNANLIFVSSFLNAFISSINSEAASTNSPETMDENNLGSPFDEANYENVDIDTCNGNVNMFTLKENQRFDDFDDAKPTYENMLSL